MRKLMHKSRNRLEEGELGLHSAQMLIRELISCIFRNGQQRALLPITGAGPLLLPLGPPPSPATTGPSSWCSQALVHREGYAELS